MIITPKTVAEVQTAVQTSLTIHIRGGGSKPALSMPNDSAALLEMNGLNGILAYQPDEYTVTAFAGTAVSTITAELIKQGQYLPFDPILIKQGATLGGTVAANTSGSGRYRYGGVRDFILAVNFVDGQGQLVRGGGKVVKNSAGFDLPKLMVGSLGQLGVLVELTFKLFPQPREYVTMCVGYPDLDTAMEAIYQLTVMPFEMDAVDIELREKPTLVIRLGGLVKALPGRMERLANFLQEKTGGEPAVFLQNDDNYWQSQNSFNWVPTGHALIKIPLAPKQILHLDNALEHFPRRYTVGGNVAWVAVPERAGIVQILNKLGLVGLQLTGKTTTFIIGQQKGQALTSRVKQALDPMGKFLP
jgi:glycolate oxidase FAD binding subunit